MRQVAARARPTRWLVPLRATASERRARLAGELSYSARRRIRRRNECLAIAALSGENDLAGEIRIAVRHLQEIAEVRAAAGHEVGRCRRVDAQLPASAVASAHAIASQTRRLAIGRAAPLIARKRERLL